jgi:hypothetical protein
MVGIARDGKAAAVPPLSLRAVSTPEREKTAQLKKSARGLPAHK